MRMRSDYASLIAEAIRNLPEKSEYSRNGVAYGVREIFEFKSWIQKTEKMSQGEWHFERGELVFAEDSCGNYFTIRSDNSVRFLDHETDERTALGCDLRQFLEGLSKPKEIAMPPHKVLRVWTRPGFKPKFK
jgi:hypothetical protein